VTTYRLSRAAEADIIDLLAWIHDQFGEQARQRYEKLIAAAIRDIAKEPTRSGSVERPELGIGVRSWHLRGSRYHNAGDVVRRPRHFLIYRVENDLLIIGRILHDAMELHRHVDADRSWR
jgi:toxin ParE1/3/4